MNGVETVQSEPVETVYGRLCTAGVVRRAVEKTGKTAGQILDELIEANL